MSVGQLVTFYLPLAFTPHTQPVRSHAGRHCTTGAHSGQSFAALFCELFMMPAAASRLPRLKTAGFVIANLWVAFHVFAIAISPAPMPPASPLLVDASRVALPYNQLLFLNHGYHYFAPDPGPSTLISYQIDRPGDTAIKGRIPDVAIAPRLRYHRYFMLAENIWGFPETMQEPVFRAYAQHFAAKHNADQISLNVISHRPSSISRILAGGQLSDPEMFSEEPLESYDFSESGSASKPSQPPQRELQLRPAVQQSAATDALEPQTRDLVTSVPAQE